MAEKAIPGELLGLFGATCTCGRHLALQVCHSTSGYFLGYECHLHGVLSRETGHFSLLDQARNALDDFNRTSQPPLNVRRSLAPYEQPEGTAKADNFFTRTLVRGPVLERFEDRLCVAVPILWHNKGLETLLQAKGFEVDKDRAVNWLILLMPEEGLMNGSGFYTPEQWLKAARRQFFYFHRDQFALFNIDISYQLREVNNDKEAS